MKLTRATRWGIYVCLVLFATATQAIVPPPPPYYYLQAQHSGKCIHQTGATQANGGAVSQWECINQDNVKLHKSMSTDGTSFALRFVHSNKCLSITNNGKPITTAADVTNGLAITQEDCIMPSNHQLWREVKTDVPPYVKIQAYHPLATGYCLHQQGGVQANGGPLTLWSCIDQPNLRWQFIEAPSITSCPVATFGPGGKLHIPKLDATSAGLGTYTVDMEMLNYPLFRVNSVGTQ